MKNYRMLWPGGREKAMTMSYDDAVLQDIRLIDLMNKNGVKGTFNLNSGLLGGKNTLIREGRLVQHNKVAAEDVAKIYAGHEVAVHTVTHPALPDQPDARVIDEVITDRRNLETLVGYPVRGMAYPSVNPNERVIELVKKCGIVYARAGSTTKRFDLPEKWLNWECSCHHWDLEPMIDPFLREEGLKLLSIWGHSYEFDQREDWTVIENQLQRLGGHAEVWYATNIEVFDYIEAFRSLKTSVEECYVYNQSCQSVWVCFNGQTREIPSGQIAEL